MQLFEPAEKFETNLAEQDPSLKRVGENPAYDSNEESDQEMQKAISNQERLEMEYEQI